MPTASRMTGHLLRLADVLSAEQGLSPDAISMRALGKGGFFGNLRRGGDCRTATAERVFDWFEHTWPHGLRWPDDVPRRPATFPAFSRSAEAEAPTQLPGHDAEFLAWLAHAPIWVNGRRPSWWADIDVRAWLADAHRQMSVVEAARRGAMQFGARCPKKSAICEFWQRLDHVIGAPATSGPRDIARPPKPRKEAA